MELGYAATGAGQGLLQQRQYNDQQARQKELYGLQERQVGLQERGFEDDKRHRDLMFGQTRIGQIEGILRDPESKNRYTRGELDKLRKDLDKLYSKYPDLDLRDHAPKPAPEAPPEAKQADPGLGATAAQVQAAAVNPALFGIPAPTNEQQIAQDLPQMGPSQFDPMGIKPSLPDRPIPNTGAGVTGSQNAPAAGSFPPNILPPPAQDPTRLKYAAPEQGRGPMDSQPTPEQMPLDKQIALGLQQQAIAKLQEAKDPNLAPVDRDKALQAATNLALQIAQIEGANATTVFQRLQSLLYPGRQAAEIGQITEQTRAQRMDTDVFKPWELRSRDDAAALEYRAKMLDAIDKAQDRAMEARRYNLSVEQLLQQKREFDAGAQKRLLDLGLTAAQIKEYQSRPDWRTKLMAETAAQNAYVKQWPGNNVIEGPTLGAFNNMMGGTPGGGGGLSFETFNHSAYIADPESSPQAKVNFYKSQGWKVPPELVAAASKAKPKAKK